MNKKIKLRNKLLISFIYILIAITRTDGGVSQYLFCASQKNYSPIQGTVLFSGTWDDSNSALLPIPFSFTFNGIAFDSLSVSSNGFITLGALTTTVYCGLQASGSNSIAAYGTDLMGNPGSTVQYGVTGTPPFQQFIVEWADCSHYQSTVDHYSFQIILHQSSNIIEIVYGPFTVQTTMGANNCLAIPTESGNVGLKGLSDSDINIRCITNGINDWSTSIAGNNLQDVCNLSPLNFPSEGMTYRWNPIDMFYVSGNTTNPNNDSRILRNSVNNVIQQLRIVATGHNNPLYIDSITFSTTGSTNPGSDLSEANIYMTGSDSVFSNASRFGYTVSEPNGIHTISGFAPLLEGNNYFWLAYDISSGANFNDSVLGCFLSTNGNNTIGNQMISFDSSPGYQVISSPALSLKVFIESYYMGNNKMLPIIDPYNLPLALDSVTVELHNVAYPYNVVYKSISILNTDGIGLFNFPDEVLSKSYYLAIRHRNSIETWSKNPVFFEGSITFFDFTSP